MEMMKINRYDSINADKIESILGYDTNPVFGIARIAREQGICDPLNRNKPVRTMIICMDGRICLCPLLPETYRSRIGNITEYVLADPKRVIIRGNMIRSVTTEKLTEAQKREIKKAKSENMYIDLTRGKKTRYYFFMQSGRIYGINRLNGEAEETLFH